MPPDFLLTSVENHRCFICAGTSRAAALLPGLCSQTGWVPAVALGEIVAILAPLGASQTIKILAGLVPPGFVISSTDPH